MKMHLMVAAAFFAGLMAVLIQGIPTTGDASAKVSPARYNLAAMQALGSGQCASSPTPSCSVYETCFMKYCQCKGDPDEYFETYGLKYCRAFLANANFSEQGRKWRDSTLICLQESIVPKLDISATPKCDCSAMRAFAFASHVACYTQPGKSICDLPADDISEIRKTISLPDMLSGDGRKQMAQVVSICTKTATDDGRRSAWKALAILIGGG